MTSMSRRSSALHGEESKEAVTFAFSPAVSAKHKQRALYSEPILANAHSHATMLPIAAHRLSLTSTASVTSASNSGPVISVSSFKGSKLMLDALPSQQPLSSLLRPANETPHRILGNDLAPKVMVPYVSTDRQALPPRRIAVERKKREYARHSIETLLLEHGIDYSQHSTSVDHSTGMSSFLPLELFDDRDYDSHTPSEWLALAANNANKMIEGKCLRLDGSGRGGYHDCTVYDYDSASDQWTIQYSDSGIKSTTHRLHCYFASEDPRVYTRRVAYAHYSRRMIEAKLRRALYIDLMPNDSARSIDSEQINRMLFLALNTKKLRLSSGDTSAVVSEIHLDYSRACNEILFNSRHMEKEETKQIEVQLIELKNENPNENASASIPAHDYAQHFSDFCFHSFLTKIEAINALTSVNVECQRLANTQSLFVSHYSKSVRIEEFEQTQSNAINNLSHHVREKLLPLLSTNIKAALRDCEKGWLNLSEVSREIYEYSKLKRLMLLINLMISNSVRECVERNAGKYLQMIEAACAYSVAIKDKATVTVTSTVAGPDSDASAQPLPLFTVDLLYKEGVIVYSTPIQQLVDTPLVLFTEAFLRLNHLPQIESLTLAHLFPASTNTANGGSAMSAIDSSEGPMVAIHDRVRALLTQSLAPLADYITLYHSYHELLSLSVDDYIKEFNAKFANDLDMMKKEILYQLARRNESEASIPRTVSFGVIVVNTEDLKRKVLNKHGELVTRLFELLQRWCKQHCDEAQRVAMRLEQELKALILEIPQLIKFRQWLVSIPSAINTLKKSISDILLYFDLLDQFQYKTNKELLKLKWTIFSIPKQLYEVYTARESSLSSDYQSFLTELHGQKEELLVDVADCEKKLQSLNHVHDCEQLERLHERCELLTGSIASILAKAKQFNQSELLLNVPHTDYRHLAGMSEQIEANSLLFTTAYQWQRCWQQWKTGPVNELNGTDITTTVTTMLDRLDQCSLSKVIKDNNAHSLLLVALKRDIEAFKPVLPLIVALRNEGMKERHWKLLLQQLPFEFSITDESLTLTRLIDEYQLHQYIDSITEISNLASKEFAIEKALVKMESAWHSKEFVLHSYGSSGTFIVDDINVKDIVAMLAEHAALTVSMADSPNRAVFNDRIVKWAQRLSTASAAIAVWTQTQALWLALEPQFTDSETGAELARALPAEAKKFSAVTKSWKLVMAQCHASPDVLSFADSTALLSKMNDSKNQLMAVKGKLDDWNKKNAKDSECDGDEEASDEQQPEVVEPASAVEAAPISVPEPAAASIEVAGAAAPSLSLSAAPVAEAEAALEEAPTEVTADANTATAEMVAAEIAKAETAKAETAEAETAEAETADADADDAENDSEEEQPALSDSEPSLPSEDAAADADEADDTEAAASDSSDEIVTPTDDSIATEQPAEQ